MTTPKPCTMPEEVFVNEVHVEFHVVKREVFTNEPPNHFKAVKYIRADRYDRLLQTNDILDREIGVMQQEINRLRADLVEKIDGK